MANKRITDVDFISSLTSDQSFFVNHNNSIKQINKGDVVFDIVNGGTGANNASDARINLGLGSVATEDVVPVSKGGTGGTSATSILLNLGVTATASELNIMDGIDATTKELNYCSGVTSNIQTQLNNIGNQLDGKAPSSHGTHVTYGTSTAALGTAAAGTASTVSRSDHVHALPALTSCTGTLTVAKGGTGSSNGATGLKNLFAAGATVLTEGTSYQYGTSLPSAGTKGRIFFKKVSN